MLLPDLPTDVLLGIADYLHDADLNALSCINRQVYDILNWHLYRRDMTKSQRPWFWYWKRGMAVTRYWSRSLFWAIKNGVEGTLQWALAPGQHLDPLPDCYDCALVDAVNAGDVRLVKLLLKVDGLDPNLLRGLCERPPLAEAARQGNIAVIELLLAAVDINPNAGDRFYHFSALHWACKIGHVHIVKQLLARDDVNVNAIDVYNSLPLHYGTMHADVVKLLLLREGIDVNAQNLRGWTALTLAAYYNGFEAAKLLLLLERDDIDLN